MSEKKSKLKRKRIKKSFVYGITAGILGAATSGIVVPIVIAANKIHDYNPLPGINGETHLTDNLTVNQITDALKSAGIQDKTLLNKTEYQTAFYLYDKEEYASLNYEKLQFEYQQFKQLNDMVKTLANNCFDVKNKTATQAKGVFNYDNGKTMNITANDSQQTIAFGDLLRNSDGSANFAAYKNIFDDLITNLNNNLKKLQDNNPKNVWKSRIDSLKSSIKDYQDKWNHENSGLTSKLSKIDRLSNSDYDNSNFSSWYPDILQPKGELKGSISNWFGTGIYGKQAKVFMDARHNFIKNYHTKEEGEVAWAKELSKDYNGATTEREAIDSLVYKVVQNSAFGRNKYKISNDYSVDQLLSGVFVPILGKVDMSKFGYDNAGGLYYSYTKWSTPFSKDFSISESTKLTTDKYLIKRDQKLFFFSTESKDVNLINVNTSTKLPDIFANRHMMSVQNAILGFKQGTDTSQGWTVSKEILQKLLRVKGDNSGKTTDLVADQYEKIFQQGQDSLTKDLVAFSSLTKDGTQYKSGSLGYMPGLQATGMAEGFGLGMLAAYDDVQGTTGGRTPWFSSKAVTDAPDLLTKIRDAVVHSFIKAAQDTGGIKIPTTNPEDIFKKDNNKAISNFINHLPDDKIKFYFGLAINDVFNNEHGGITTKTQNGIGQVFRISKSTNYGIYAFYDSQYGLHIVKIDTTPFNSGSQSFIDDMQKAADNGDPKAANTDYGNLYSANYPMVDQIDSLLKGPDGSDYKSYLEKNIKDYTPVSTGTDPIAQDVTKLISNLKQADGFNRIDKSNWDKLFDYLKKGFDDKVINQDLSMDPKAIYHAIEEMGGIQ